MKHKKALKRLYDAAEKLNLNTCRTSFKLVEFALKENGNRKPENMPIIRPCNLTGSGKWVRYSDNTERVKELLDTIAIPYSFGNDAPRGGKAGNYIRLITIKTKTK